MCIIVYSHLSGVAPQNGHPPGVMPRRAGIPKKKSAAKCLLKATEMTKNHLIQRLLLVRSDIEVANSKLAPGCKANVDLQNAIKEIDDLIHHTLHAEWTQEFKAEALRWIKFIVESFFDDWS